MRRPNPLSEILESSMLQAEPIMDTEWPAADDLLLVQAKSAEVPRSSFTPRAFPRTTR